VDSHAVIFGTLSHPELEAKNKQEQLTADNANTYSLPPPPYKSEAAELFNSKIIRRSFNDNLNHVNSQSSMSALALESLTNDILLTKYGTNLKSRKNANKGSIVQPP
jgi:hypothetical protein